MTDWQPIETVPKDVPVLLATTVGICVGKFDEWSDKTPYLVDDDGWMLLNMDESASRPVGTVIYWAPLPVLLTSA
jgi:hypothetical protein